MFPAALITLRETLEASLIIAIILACVEKVENRKHSIVVWSGVFAGVSVSFLLALFFESIIGGFTGRSEELYEGSMMLAGSLLLTWMIVWMLKRRKTIRSDIQQKVQSHLEKEHLIGLFFLALVSTAREAVETIIFLKASILHTNAGMEVFGGLSGIFVAVCLSYFLFRGIEILPIKKFFTITSILLMIFAATLFVHGIEEFAEAGVFSFSANGQ